MVSCGMNIFLACVFQFPLTACLRKLFCEGGANSSRAVAVPAVE